jgi:site-specific recombinase XerD
MVRLLEQWAPATASNRYRALQAFFRWCVEEGELHESPMRHMRPPHVPEVPVTVLSAAAFAATREIEIRMRELSGEADSVIGVTSREVARRPPAARRQHRSTTS